jgi:hypothetical protein
MSTATTGLQDVRGTGHLKNMPETIVLADGTEREVPTAEEQKAFSEQAEKFKPLSDQFETLKTELDLKDGETITDKLKELKESANPNWQKTRTLIKTLKGIASEKGVEVDDDGNVITKSANLTAEEAQKIADETFEKRSVTAKKAEALADFSKEDADSIEAIFNKLQTLGGTFEENMGLAISKIAPSQVDKFNRAITSSGGGAPRIKPSAGANAMSDDAKNFAKSKLGLTDKDLEAAGY